MESKIFEYKKILNVEIYALGKKGELISENQREVYLDNIVATKLTESETKFLEKKYEKSLTIKDIQNLNSSLKSDYFLQTKNKLEEASTLCNKIHNLNKSNIKRFR